MRRLIAPYNDFVADKNPKAFAYANPGRLAKSAARSHDVSQIIIWWDDVLTNSSSRRSGSMFPKSIESPKNHPHDSSPLLGLRA